MANKQYRTIEDRLEQIESDISIVKMMLEDVLSATVKPVDQTEGFLSVKDVAHLLKIETPRIYSACNGGELKFIKIGKLYKFTKDDVMQWVETHKVTNQFNVDEYVEKYLQKNVLKG